MDKDVSACKLLREQHIDKEERVWMAYLATRRDTFIVPTTNCLGYLRNDRLDAGIDPNRDFPYLRKDDKCFLSTTANIVRELFRTSIIQVLYYNENVSLMRTERGHLPRRHDLHRIRVGIIQPPQAE